VLHLFHRVAVPLDYVHQHLPIEIVQHIFCSGLFAGTLLGIACYADQEAKRSQVSGCCLVHELLHGGFQLCHDPALAVFLNRHFFAQCLQVRRSHDFSTRASLHSYIAIESGGGGLYVTHFPDAEGKWQISSGAAIRALHWLPDGHALLYEKADGTIMKVPFVTHGKDVEIGTPQVYIHARPRSAAYGVTWDVAADGRLIVNTLITEPTHTVNVVMNWTAGLKK
jgi:hypothetical protein